MEVYQFKCDVAEIHGTYHCVSMLMWNSLDEEEWVAGDAFTVEAEQVPGFTEHDQIMDVIRLACHRIAGKHDRTIF
jgi:hypothetical protein